MSPNALRLPFVILLISAAPMVPQATSPTGPQTQPSTSAPPAQQPAKPDAQQPEMFLTGCLRSSGADTSVAGPSGRIYTLEVIEGATPPTGVSAPAGTGARSTTIYSLAASESIGLAKHVDTAVQLTGRLQAPSTAVTTTRPAASVAPPKPGGAHRTFEVSALKVVASQKC